MRDVIDQIISLRGEDSRILSVFVELIGLQMDREGASSDRINAILDDPNTYTNQLARYNPEEVTSIKNLLTAIFQNDQSIQMLVEKLEDYDSRFLAITFLGWFGEKARSVIPEFIGVIGSGHPANAAAKRAIQLIGGGEELVLSAIKQSIMQEDDASFLELIDLALHTQLRESKEFDDVFSLGAKSKNPQMRWAAAFWISQLPEASKQSMKKI